MHPQFRNCCCIIICTSSMVSLYHYKVILRVYGNAHSFFDRRISFPKINHRQTFEMVVEQTIWAIKMGKPSPHGKCVALSFCWYTSIIIDDHKWTIWMKIIVNIRNGMDGWRLVDCISRRIQLKMVETIGKSHNHNMNWLFTIKSLFVAAPTVSWFH